MATADTQEKTMVRHTAIYATGTILRNVATFAMLPIYTRFLTPADYGIIDLLTMVVELFAMVFGLRIGDAVFRYHAEYASRQDKHEVITTALMLVGALTLVGYLIIVALAKPLSLIVFQDVRYANDLRLFAVTLPLSAVTEVAFLYLRADARPWMFVGFSTLRLVLQLGLNIYFVVVREMHVEGVVYASVVAYAASAALLLSFTLARTGLSYSRPKARELADFSWPLILAALATFYLTVGGRYLLQLFEGPAEVGIYSLGYKFGFLLLVFAWGPFSTAWEAQRFALARQRGPGGDFNTIFTPISIVIICVALGIGVFAGDVLTLMSDPQFWPAASVVPVILVAYVFQGWTGFANLGILVSGKTMQMASATFFGCIVMTVSCLLLIPVLGSMGAAIGTLLGFLFRFFWVYYRSKRIYDMRLDWGKVSRTGAVAATVYMFSLASPAGTQLSILAHTLEMLLFLLLLATLPILSPGERAMIIGIAKNPRKARAVLTGAE